MREYTMPDGTLVPAELQEKIADDVRAFDAAQTPDARSATALRKISNELPRLRQVLTGSFDDQTTANRLATAMEIQTLLDLGFDPNDVGRTHQARMLARRYGFPVQETTDHE